MYQTRAVTIEDSQRMITKRIHNNNIIVIYTDILAGDADSQIHLNFVCVCVCVSSVFCQ